MTATPKTLRTRALTAANRSLKLIADAVADHQAALDRKEAPDGSFTASVLKYEAALARLSVLDELSGAAPAGAEEPAEVLVQRDDLDVLIAALQAVLPDLRPEPGTPLERIFAALSQDAAETAPAEVPS